MQLAKNVIDLGLPLAGMLMMPTLVAFMRAYPEMVLDLDFSDRVVDVIEEGFDAVMRFAEAGDSRLMSRALGTYRRRLVAAPAYLAAKGVPRTPDDLKAHACLHHKFPTSGKFERWPLRPEHAGIETELAQNARGQHARANNLFGRAGYGHRLPAGLRHRPATS